MSLVGSTTRVASAAQTATGNSAAIVVSSLTIGLVLSVTAAAGTTPTLDVTLEWSADGVTFFSAQPADSFTQLIAVGGAVKSFTCKQAFYRIKWTITGSAGQSFTFSVSEMTF